ncbi:hypothetical protein CKM354_000930400 [Cercospora kikuchii]|uniref:Uncharacterized protein n=1 Tax=Cercospora kikuchii TaxID=84275 RepID=A0A9P3CP48_9PEZI|nr:uncharacterized protein CKM354_000930400 [Cercospora kikuchii]GIZ46166.1 hypothetical protein CKM354_000930400 [Cercospora kikuchii]
MHNDRSSSHRRGPHGRHHDQNFPPQRYCDLSHHDMLLLAPLFRPMPLPLDSSYAAHASALQARILGLPAHLLRSKPETPSSSFASRFSSSSSNDHSTFCELHKNLSPRPIESLVRCLKCAVHLDELKKYDFENLQMQILGDMVVTWGSNGRIEGFGGGMSLDVKYGPVSAEFVEDDDDEQEVGGLRRMLSLKGRKNGKKERKVCCAACRLSNVAGDLYGLQILGAFVAGDVGRRNWKASKRLRWMEIWYASWKGENAEMREVVKPMWEMAVEFARYRYDASGRDSDSHRGEDGRDWIEEFQGEVVQNKRRGRQEGRAEMGFQHQVPSPDHFVDRPLPDPFVDGPLENERENGAETWRIPSPPISPLHPPAHPRRRAPDAMSTASSFYSQHSAMNDWDDFRQSQEPLRPMATPGRPHEHYPTPSSVYSGGPQSSGHVMSRGRRDPASTISQIIDLYDR